MRINAGSIWTLTKWLMVVAVAYFGWQIFRIEKTFEPGSSSIVGFNYNYTNPDHAMNIIRKSTPIPIQVDSILVDEDGEPEYFAGSNGRLAIKAIMQDGSTREILVHDIHRIYYVKKGETL